MQQFKEQVHETTQMRIIDLLPKKVKHMIYRIAHQDKYKGALLMIKHLRKDPDVISRGLSKKKIQDIAADHFKLNHREFEKILNRKTRYEEAPPGMADTVKKFKADGMDDDMAFALAWKIYNKKKEEVESITEGFTINPDKASDIDSLPQYSLDQKKAVKKLYSIISKSTGDTAPIVFNDDGKDKDIKIKRIWKDSTDLNTLSKIDNLPKILYGDGSSKKRTVALKQFGIKNDTQFLEFCQSIGFFISNPLDESNFKSELNGLTINGDFKIRNYITGWNKFITLCFADKSLQSDVILLVNGSYFYKETINIPNPYIIWTSIKKYYTALKSKEGITGDVKENTADCVLINGTEADLYAALGSDAPIISDDKTGMLSCNGINWYQISLKKVKGGAKLGKITTLIKGMYDIEDGNLEASGLETIYKELELEQNQINIEFHQILQEGLFNDGLAKFKDLGKATLNAFKAAVVKIKKWSGDLFKNMNKLLGQETKKEDRFMQSITRGLVMERKATAAQVMNSIVNDKGPRGANKKYVKHVEQTFKTVKVINSKTVASNIQENKDIVVDKNTIAFLASNCIAFNILNKITADVNKNGIDVINTMNASMQMGDTKLPVVKVYGKKDGVSVDILTVGTISQTDPALTNKDIKLCMLSIKPEKKYYVINMYIFAELKNDEPHYHKISFKKHGESSLTFDIEGATTSALSKIKDFT